VLVVVVMLASIARIVPGTKERARLRALARVDMEWRCMA
jgi:hypothetical protein